MEFQKIAVETSINAPIEKVWQHWNEPEQVKQWNNASPDWHTPKAENDLTVGGKFSYRMEAKDGSFGFDFEGIYDNVHEHKLVSYTMADGRKVETTFTAEGGHTRVETIFDAETENSIEMQKGGWQAILDNFKKHVENY
jgi:uncharacterized protein YndB with AHSA1/START domain